MVAKPLAPRVAQRGAVRLSRLSSIIFICSTIIIDSSIII